MPPEEPAAPSASAPITELTDPRALTILSTEHWSQLSARSLAYNEAFTRGGMFLTFLSASLVALALLAQGMAFGNQFLVVAAIVLAFDFIIGLTTYGRITDANVDDLRAMHAMARIRNGYIQAAPLLEPFFTSQIHDDIDSVVAGYGEPASSGIGLFWYGLTTSAGMIGLVVSMVGGVLAGVLALMMFPAAVSVWVGVGAAVLTFAIIAAVTFGSVPRNQGRLTVRFPGPGKPETPDR